MKDKLQEVWEQVRDPYWRADHPEVAALIVSFITGFVGIFFAWVQAKIINREQRR